MKINPPENGLEVFPVTCPRSFVINDPSGRTTVCCEPAASQWLQDGASHFVVAFGDKVTVSNDTQSHQLGAECFGVFQGEARLEGDGSALVISVSGYRGQTLAGGPIENIGRLRYMDGCTTSLLLAPPFRGEPCLNFMHLPPDVTQTMHTHPSLRIGLILSGFGKCATDAGVVEFLPGTVFVILPEVSHSFRSSDEALRIVVYHADSDCGPTHSDHTMLNRTFVDSESASLLQNLHTKATSA